VARPRELRHNSVVKIDDLSTRDAVARSVLENGPSTAVILGARLRLTPPGIRRHLEILVADGILEARDPHVALTRGRGRPSKVFVMTDAGREQFEHSYDDLAVAALKFMSSQSGEHQVYAFAQSRADDIERKATAALAKSGTKTESLATFLTEQGYAASVEVHANGEQLLPLSPMVMACAQLIFQRLPIIRKLQLPLERHTNDNSTPRTRRPRKLRVRLVR